MSTSVVKTNVRGKELPSKWAKEIDAQPEDVYIVTVQSKDDRKVQLMALQGIMEQISEEAKRNGFSEADLEEILERKEKVKPTS